MFRGAGGRGSAGLSQFKSKEEEAAAAGKEQGESAAANKTAHQPPAALAGAAGVAAGGESGETGGKDLLYARMYRDGKSRSRARAHKHARRPRALTHTHIHKSALWSPTHSLTIICRGPARPAGTSGTSGLCGADLRFAGDSDAPIGRLGQGPAFRGRLGRERDAVMARIMGDDCLGADCQDETCDVIGRRQLGCPAD